MKYTAEQNSKVVSTINSLRAKHLTANQIVAALNEQGLRTATGKKWSIPTYSFFMGKVKKWKTPIAKTRVTRTKVGSRVRKPAYLANKSNNVEIATIRELVALKSLSPVQTVNVIRSLFNS